MGAITFVDLAISFGINLAITAAFLLAYSIFSLQPVNARVYFTSWFMKDDKEAKEKYEKEGSKLVYSWKQYFHSLDWMYTALRMPERELLAHAGLDMVVYLRMFKLGVKIFFPATIFSMTILFPVYITANYLPTTTLASTSVDYCTISNIAPKSSRLWAPCLVAWAINLWALWLLRLEYEAVAQLRLDYLADQKRAPNQFTVLVRQVPADNTRTVAQKTAQFFSVVHKDNYLMTTPVYDARKLTKLEATKEWTENKLTALQIRIEKKPGLVPHHKTGFCGLLGPSVESVPFYQEQIEALNKQIVEELKRVLTDKSCVMPANFVSFRTRWGAAVAAQTQQSKDNTKWISTWAPEPEDVAWEALPIPYISITTRKFAAAIILTGTIIFYTIPVAFVQGLANLNNLEKVFPFLKPILDVQFINSLLTSFLPGLALMIFLALLPIALRFLASREGYVSMSQIDRAACGKMFYFIIFTVFFANVLVGSAWAQLQYYIKNPAELPTALGTAITGAANFFMTFTMLNAWTAVAGEVTRIVPLVLFHIKNQLLVRTPADRIKAMSSSGPSYISILPLVELYFLLCFMFWVLAPLYLPFALIFFVFGYIVYRNQFINVYTAQYDLGGGYWPHFHLRALASMVLAQVCLICVFALKEVLVATIVLLPLPFISILYHWTFIAAAFEPTFSRYALEEAMRRDTIDSVTNPDDNPRDFLARQYLHPSIKAAYDIENDADDDTAQGKVSTLSDNSDSDAPENAALVPVKRHPRSRGNSPLPVLRAVPEKTPNEVEGTESKNAGSTGGGQES